MRKRLIERLRQLVRALGILAIRDMIEVGRVVTMLLK